MHKVPFGGFTLNAMCEIGKDISCKLKEAVRREED
jgi:hypothetical protein